MKEKDSLTFQVLDIIRGTTVDGPGFRTSIYFAGCSHHCPGCHNPQSWDATGGKTMSLPEIMDIVREEDFNVTLSGGDPLYNPEATSMLVKALKDDGRNVWIYTGYTWEEILSDARLLDAVREADVVVEGPFVDSLKDKDLLFRGSSNQHLVSVKESISTGELTECQR